MIYLKLFESFNEERIHKICKKYKIENYTINEDGSIDAEYVNFVPYNLKKLPIEFRNITDSFLCSHNSLTSLEGCPKSVGGDFSCSDNRLISLEDCPESVGDNFECASNHLTSLEGCPKSVGGDFSCSYNLLTSLEGCPKSVGGGFYCSYNNLTSLEGCAELVGDFNCRHNKLTSLEDCPKSVGGNFYCDRNKIISFEYLPFSITDKFTCGYNPINQIWKLFEDYSKIEFLNDCDAIREPNIIILDRLNFFLEEIGKPTVAKVKGYKCI